MAARRKEAPREVKTEQTSAADAGRSGLHDWPEVADLERLVVLVRLERRVEGGEILLEGGHVLRWERAVAATRAITWSSH